LIVSALVLAISVIPSFAGNKVFFYHTDAAGTPVAMSDANGEVVWRADYLPFGEEHEVAGSVKNKNRFIGKEKDEETDLYYFGARYLDARTGRFIKPDPVGIRESEVFVFPE
jgi:RHS repeat-associated protein